MGATKIPASSPDFERAVAELDAVCWRPELSVEEIGSPQRIAPYSVAVSADVSDDGRDVGSGRLILLHDPAGNESWQGQFRCVAFARADVDLEMVADPLLPEVGWAWLSDALADHEADYAQPAGTVTAVYSKSFGAMAGQDDRAEIEIRASWTPYIDDQRPLTPHLLAWQDLLCTVAGLEPLPDGVVALHRAGNRR